MNRADITILAAKLAAAGLKLHPVSKAGGIQYFELRRDPELFTVGALHDVEAIAARLMPSQLAEVAA